MEARRIAHKGMKMGANEADLASKIAIEVVEVSKNYGGRSIVRDFSLRIQRGDRIGIVGPNGAGKTTVLNLLTGGLDPESGRVHLSHNLEVATMDQKREYLKKGWRAKDALTGGQGDRVSIRGKSRHVIGYLKDFLFTPEQAETPINVLSGGEKGRLLLARALANTSNLLVLDEPTNDLDIETLDLLQEMLSDYAGTILLVSHDRDFLDRIVTSVIVSEGDGRWIEYAGGYSDMVAQRGRGITAQAKKIIPKAQKPSSQRSKTKDQKKEQKKLSYKNKYALEQLPEEMNKLRQEITFLDQSLADPSFYGRDPLGFEKASKELIVKKNRLKEAEDQWLELAILQEAVEDI